MMDKKELKPTVVNGATAKPASGLSRRSMFFAAGAAGVGAAATVLAPKQATAQSTDWTQPGNNNHVIDLQNQTDFVDSAVGLDFYGHCAFKLTSPSGATILFDPWRDDPSGAWGLWFKYPFPELDFAHF